MKTYNTIPFERRNPLQAMTGVARAIALPHEHPPVRFPSFPALERTAVVSFTQPVDYTLPSTSTDNKVMLARQAAYPLWLDQSVAAANVYGLKYILSKVGTIYGVPLNAYGANVASIFGEQTATAYSVGISSNPNTELSKRGLKFPILGADAGTGPAPWVYVPAGWSVTAVVGLESGGFSAAETYRVDFDGWRAPGETDQDAAYNWNISTSSANNFAAGHLSMCGTRVATSAKWLRLSTVVPTSNVTSVFNSTLIVQILVTSYPVVNTTASWSVSTGNGLFQSSAANQGTILASNTGFSSLTALLPAVVASELTVSQVPWMQTRTTAAAVLMTNTTQALNKAGVISAGRLMPSLVDPFTATVGVVQALHPAEKAHLGLETGFYTYCPPSTDIAEFWDYISLVGTTIPQYRLDNASLVNVAFLNSSVASNFAVTVDWHLEFRNTSPLFQVGLSAMTLEALHQSQLALVSSGFFFNNENHETTVSKIIRAINTYGKGAANVLTGIHPIAGMVAHGVAKAVKVYTKPPAPTKLAVATKREPVPKKAKTGVKAKRVVVKRRK